MKLPGFLIVGAAKSGTTSLFRYLDQHPQVYMSPTKEPNFFHYYGRERPTYRDAHHQKITLRDNNVFDPEAYSSLFEDAPNGAVAGEASVLYLYSDNAPLRISEMIPSVKIVAILRNPVDRAYSHYLHLRRDAKEPIRSFEKALAAEERRIRDCWYPSFHYTRMGRYAEQLQRYFDLFPRSQIGVFLYDDLKKDPDALLARVCRFLEIDDSFSVDTRLQYNRSGTPKSRWLHRAITQPHPVKEAVRRWIPERFWQMAAAGMFNSNLRTPPALSPPVRDLLLDSFRNDIRDLERLAGLNLSSWTEAPQPFPQPTRPQHSGSSDGPSSSSQ